MQQQSQHTEQSQSQTKYTYNVPIDSHVQIDVKLLQTKQKIIESFYEADNDVDRLKIMRSWPNAEITQSIKQHENVTKTTNGWHFGKASNDMFHGFGLLIYEKVQSPNAKIHSQREHARNNKYSRFYEGEFQNNCKHGYGFQYIAGDIYVGKFVNNKPQDTNGIFMWRNGDLYMGAFINGMKHGTGRWQSGKDFYEGTWKLNRPEGKGKIHTNASDYEGDIKNGYKHGRGLQIFANGDRYQGLYANGKPQGDGTYSWKNGALYKGQFKNGIRYGYGSWSYGNESYQGDYINDKRNGRGIYKWGTQSYYKGQFLDDLRHGFGQMYWNENSFYKGQWFEGVQNGKGQIWENGVLVSKGVFEQGKLVQQPNKLLKSRVGDTIKSNSKMHHENNNNILSNSLQKPKNKPHSIRYPEINKKQRSFSHPIKDPKKSNLSKIQQFPKVQQNNKNIASTSFSNHTRNSRNSSITHQSFDNNKRHMDSKGFHLRKQSHTSNFPVSKKELPKQKKMIKNVLQQKKKLYGVSKTAVKQQENINLGQLNLGPIKWKNFTNIKDEMSNVTQFTRM